MQNRILQNFAFIKLLAGELSVAQGSHSYPRRLPAPCRKLQFSLKVDSLNLESHNQAQNIHVGLPSFPIKI